MIHNTLRFLLIVLTIWSCKENNVQKINLEELTIAKIHEQYQKGQLTSEDLVKAYITAIETSDSTINSISLINTKAVETARELDIEFKKTGKLRPLHGIPVIVKDNINTIGMPSTAGSLALKDYIPETDAFIIKKLKDAGAIVLAKSNMAEWAFSPKHTQSSTRGTTRNPYNLDHVPAGSSGGTAAAVASNFGTVGLGTDTGNSIRGPSSHNSLVGFRTTLGLISREGIVPLYLRNDVVGPMCRTVTDATRVLDVIAGYDESDPITKHSEGKIPESYMQYLDKNGLKGKRIGVLRQLSESEPDPEISFLFERAITNLKRGGAIIDDSLFVPKFDVLRQDQWCSEFRKDIEQFLKDYVKNDAFKTLEDLMVEGTTPYALNSMTYFLTNAGRRQNPEIECLDAFTDSLRIAFREAIEKEMDVRNLDAIIYPTWNNKPAHINSFNEEYLGDNNQIIAPHTGQPAFTVPMGYTEGNLPVGIQFLGRMFSEPTLISIAYGYEQETLHRVPVPDTRLTLYEYDFKENITYGTIDTVNLEFNIAIPRNTRYKNSLLLFIHGGGWKTGTRALYNDQVRKAAEKGFVAATISHRYTRTVDENNIPIYPWPAALHDVKAAVRYFKANASLYKIDTSKIAAIGASSGAHLALLLGLTDPGDSLEGEVFVESDPNQKLSSTINAVVNLSGPVDMAKVYETAKVVTYVYEFLQAKPKENPTVYEVSSPVNYISEGDPPILTIHGRLDDVVPVEQAIMLDIELNRIELYHELVILEDQGHIFKGKQAEKSWGIVYKFLERALNASN